jgi:hypothetical protein
MSACHSQVLAPYSIRSTWHPGSTGWMPRKWCHPSFLVTPRKLPVGLVWQIELTRGASRSCSEADELTSFALKLIKSPHFRSISR